MGKDNDSDLITKRDWEDYRKKVQDQYVNFCISKMNFKAMLEVCDKEIAGFPDVVDEVIDEVFEDGE